MYKIWEVKLNDFLGNYPIVDNDPPGKNSLTLEEKEYFLKKEIKSLNKKIFIQSKKEIIPEKNIYFMNTWINNEDVLIVKKYHDNFIIIGGYIGPSLWIDKDYRGLGLGYKLVIEKANLTEGQFNPESYTTAGYITHKKAHAESIKYAILNKKYIPSNVMKDYSHLHLN